MQKLCFDLILAIGADVPTLDRFMNRVYDITNREGCDVRAFVEDFYRTLDKGVKDERQRENITNIMRVRMPGALK